MPMLAGVWLISMIHDSEYDDVTGCRSVTVPQCYGDTDTRLSAQMGYGQGYTYSSLTQKEPS